MISRELSVLPVMNASQLFEIMMQNRWELLYSTANNIQLIITTL